jgi:DNA topoisomerase-2
LAELETGVAGGVDKVLKLSTTVSTTNMHLFDAECKLKKYTTISEIIDAFSMVRLATYHQRKVAQIEEMERVLVKLSNKAKYIQCVLDGTIDLRRKTTEQIDTMLLEHGLVKLGDHGYDYLVKMPMVSVSTEQVDKLMKEKADTETALAILRSTTVEQIWLRELDEFEIQYDMYVSKRKTEYTVGAPKDGGAGSRKKMVVKNKK